MLLWDLAFCPKNALFRRVKWGELIRILASRSNAERWNEPAGANNGWKKRSKFTEDDIDLAILFHPRRNRETRLIHYLSRTNSNTRAPLLLRVSVWLEAVKLRRARWKFACVFPLESYEDHCLPVVITSRFIAFISKDFRFDVCTIDRRISLGCLCAGTTLTIQCGIGTTWLCSFGWFRFLLGFRRESRGIEWLDRSENYNAQWFKEKSHSSRVLLGRRGV